MYFFSISSLNKFLNKYILLFKQIHFTLCILFNIFSILKLILPAFLIKKVQIHKNHKIFYRSLVLSLIFFDYVRKYDLDSIVFVSNYLSEIFILNTFFLKKIKHMVHRLWRNTFCALFYYCNIKSCLFSI